MARVNNLTDFLTDVADAIRDKKGTTEPINASEFDTEIASIEGGGTTKEFTGHYDTEGLRTIGWTDEDIQYYQDNGVQWDEESDNDFKLTPTELAGDDSVSTRFLPKNTTKKSFTNYASLLAIPLIDTSNVIYFSSVFRGCLSLTTIPELNTSKGTSFAQLFQNCYSLLAIPLIDTSNGEYFNSMFYYCYCLQKIPQLDTSKGTGFNSMFENCYSLKTIPELNTSKGTRFDNMFYNCYSLKAVPELDVSSGINFSNMFSNGSNIVSFGGLKNIGKAYLTSVSANYSNYTLNLSSCTKLTHDSLMNVINNLYDIASKGVQPQKLQLGNTNLAKLTEEEKAIAINKGWNVS